MNLDGIQTKKQILPESPSGCFGCHIRVGSRQNSNVDASRGRGADSLEFTGFQDAKKLRLQIQRDVGDFIE